MPNLKLKDKIAVVTGASRGAGRGIATVLGAAGATVYVTGRSSTAGNFSSDMTGTIEETAQLVTAGGGKGIAVRCDHTDESQVAALYERVKNEQGRLDLLVNNAWGGYEHYDGQTFPDGTKFLAPFWEQSMQRWQGMFEAGVRAHILSSRYAAPLMLPQRAGLIVNTTAWANNKYLGNLFYDLAKATVNRMALAMSHDLQPYGIAAVTLAPGFMRTERVLATDMEDLSVTESTEYIGRAVLALATDPNLLQKSGQVLAVGDLAKEYGFTDVDGRQIAAFDLPNE